jgi:DNA polymerase III alpha subunit (gram-positive type)
MLALLYDTETTGLISNHTIKLTHQPHIIEFYGCVADLKSGEVIREVHHLIKPPIEIDQEIIDITTITNDDVSKSPSFDKVSGEIFKFIEEAPILIAHNASFDKEIMDLEAERLKRTINWPRKILCTVEQTIALKGMRLTLSDLHNFLFGETFSGAHRANVDVKALLRCCVELHKRDII